MRKDTRAAAELFLRHEPSKLGLEAVHAIIDNDRMLYFTPTPTGVMAFSEHMVRTGQLKTKLTMHFFDKLHDLPGRTVSTTASSPIAFACFSINSRATWQRKIR